MASCQAVTDSGVCGKEVDAWVKKQMAKHKAVPLCFLHAAQYFLNRALRVLTDLEISHPELRYTAELPARDYIQDAAACLQALEE